MSGLVEDRQEGCDQIKKKTSIKSFWSFIKNISPEIFKISLQAFFSLVIAIVTALYVTNNINTQRLANISIDNIRNRNSNAMSLFRAIRVKPVDEFIKNSENFPIDTFQRMNAEVQEYLVGLMAYGTGELRDFAYDLFKKTTDIENRMMNLHIFSIHQPGEIKKNIMASMDKLMKEYAETLGEGSARIMALIAIDSTNAENSFKGN